MKSFINPDLCEITEDLVYTEPFNDVKKRNDPFPPNLDFIRRELYEDREIRLESAKMKFDFFCNTQCLVHGDLHTGSVFVREDSTKVIDPEFAYYGPAGYDVGNVIANLIFAWANADTVMEAGTARTDFTGWLEKTIEEVMSLFVSKWRQLWAAEGHRGGGALRRVCRMVPGRDPPRCGRGGGSGAVPAHRGYRAREGHDLDHGAGRPGARGAAVHHGGQEVHQGAGTDQDRRGLSGYHAESGGRVSARPGVRRNG